MTTLQEDAEAFRKAWREFVLKGGTTGEEQVHEPLGFVLQADCHAEKHICQLIVWPARQNVAAHRTL